MVVFAVKPQRSECPGDPLLIIDGTSQGERLLGERPGTLDIGEHTGEFCCSGECFQAHRNRRVVVGR